MIKDSMKSPTDSFKGLASIMCGTFIFAFQGVMIRQLGGTFSPLSQGWGRFFVEILILFSLIVLHKKYWSKIHKKDYPWFIIWSLCGCFPMILLFIVFNNLAIGTSYFLFFATMLVGGIIMGRVLFKEVLHKAKVAALVLSLWGMCLIYNADVFTGSKLYMFLALVAGFNVALWNTFSKKISHRYSNIQLIFIQACVGCAFIFIGSMILHDPFPHIVQWQPIVWLIIYAVSEIVAGGLIIYGFKHLEAQIASILMPVEIIYGAIIGYLFYKEILSPQILFGGLCIFIAALLPYFVKER